MVWVKWIDPTTSNDWLPEKVRNLDGNADISDLRVAFVEQRRSPFWQQVDPATVEVSKSEGGEALEANASVREYFVPPPNAAPVLAGQSKDTALVLTLPPQQQQQQQVSRDLCFVSLDNHSVDSTFHFDLLCPPRRTTANRILSVGRSISLAAHTLWVHRDRIF